MDNYEDLVKRLELANETGMTLGELCAEAAATIRTLLTERDQDRRDALGFLKLSTCQRHCGPSYCETCIERDLLIERLETAISSKS